MSIEDLLRERRIHKHRASKDDLRKLAVRAESDLAAALGGYESQALPLLLEQSPALDCLG
jgi:hypothetical protein